MIGDEDTKWELFSKYVWLSSDESPSTPYKEKTGVHRETNEKTNLYEIHQMIARRMSWYSEKSPQSFPLKHSINFFQFAT